MRSRQFGLDASEVIVHRSVFISVDEHSLREDSSYTDLCNQSLTRSRGDDRAMNHLPSKSTMLVIVVCAATMLSLSMGLRQSLGIFMLPLTRDVAISVSDFT